jgi:peptidoglycan/LPS O-acetylase OafA/YrhL
MLPSPPRAEILSLTGMRAFAALWVLLYHLNPEVRAVLDPSGPGVFLFKALTKSGYLGVDLFFILSGFIISYNYGGKFPKLEFRAWGDFLWMRLARVWPVHVTVLLAYVAVLLVTQLAPLQAAAPWRFSPAAFVSNLFLVQAWSIPTVLSWNEPAWSVSCEWLAYLLFPLLWLSPLSRLRAGRALFVSIVLLLAVALFCELAGFKGTAAYGIPRLAGGFAAGCCVYRMYSLGFGSGWNWAVLTPLLLGLVLAVSAVLLHFELFAFGATPLLGLLLLGIAYQRCHVSRFLGSHPLRFLGAASYSIYMVHELCTLALRRLLPVDRLGEAYGLLVPGAWLLVIFMTGIALFLFVERPCRDFMRALRRRAGAPRRVA